MESPNEKTFLQQVDAGLSLFIKTVEQKFNKYFSDPERLEKHPGNVCALYSKWKSDNLGSATVKAQLKLLDTFSNRKFKVEQDTTESVAQLKYNICKEHGKEVSWTSGFPHYRNFHVNISRFVDAMNILHILHDFQSKINTPTSNFNTHADYTQLKNTSEFFSEISPLLQTLIDKYKKKDDGWGIMLSFLKQQIQKTTKTNNVSATHEKNILSLLDDLESKLTEVNTNLEKIGKISEKEVQHSRYLTVLDTLKFIQEQIAMTFGTQDEITSIVDFRDTLSQKIASRLITLQTTTNALHIDTATQLWSDDFCKLMERVKVEVYCNKKVDLDKIVPKIQNILDDVKKIDSTYITPLKSQASALSHKELSVLTRSQQKNFTQSQNQQLKILFTERKLFDRQQLIKELQEVKLLIEASLKETNQASTQAKAPVPSDFIKQLKKAIQTHRLLSGSPLQRKLKSQQNQKVSHGRSIEVDISQKISTSIDTTHATPPINIIRKKDNTRDNQIMGTGITSTVHGNEINKINTTKNDSQTTQTLHTIEKKENKRDHDGPIDENIFEMETDGTKEKNDETENKKSKSITSIPDAGSKEEKDLSDQEVHNANENSEKELRQLTNKDKDLNNNLNITHSSPKITEQTVENMEHENTKKRKDDTIPSVLDDDSQEENDSSDKTDQETGEGSGEELSQLTDKGEDLDNENDINHNSPKTQQHKPNANAQSPKLKEKKNNDPITNEITEDVPNQEKNDPSDNTNQKADEDSGEELSQLTDKGEDWDNKIDTTHNSQKTINANAQDQKLKNTEELEEKKEKNNPITDEITEEVSNDDENQDIDTSKTSQPSEIKDQISKINAQIKSSILPKEIKDHLYALTKYAGEIEKKQKDNTYFSPTFFCCGYVDYRETEKPTQLLELVNDLLQIDPSENEMNKKVQKMVGKVNKLLSKEQLSGKKYEFATLDKGQNRYTSWFNWIKDASTTTLIKEFRDDAQIYLDKVNGVSCCCW